MKTTTYEIQIEAYLNYLRNEERSPVTIEQYRRDILCFFSFLDDGELTKAAALSYKEELEEKYQPASVNVKLSALNSFFGFIGRSDLKLKFMKICLLYTSVPQRAEPYSIPWRYFLAFLPFR